MPLTPDISLLTSFELQQTLSEDPDRCRLTLLGTLPSTWNETASKEGQPLQAIIRIEKNAFASEHAALLLKEVILKTEVMDSTDIYTWIAGWSSPQGSEAKQPQGDVKINVICPATDVHVRKYTKQHSILVQETPELYHRIIEPYINSIPPERTRWVTEILAGRSEQGGILYTSSECLILPDMKWDLHTISSLYLLVIARDPGLRSLRDLRGDVHLRLLKSIRKEAYRVVGERWGIERGGLRMFIHYQPSYYHFHVHVVNANYELSGVGMAVGQAHLLDDVISLLEVSPDIFKNVTLTYNLGEQHGLYDSMRIAQTSVEVDE
ncbi:scavenger mRNA decapping enzyme [Rhodocollybia butyracea]|uniref:Scavenger mRNA decapping enzyme n=1 Tax=Rhodocollybia butyracea TaxID=206335 RepID=A0A9P5QAA0_9AGAR|nr:scavenger mRNA decapping enzyme [Rhodocollybia butyracea]